MENKTKKYNIDLDERGNLFINDIKIDCSIFEEEKSDYKVVERDEQINDLCMWIGESKNEGDKFLMKEDLKYLMELEDYYIFSEIGSNGFIAKSDNLKEFNNICKNILKLNEEIKE
jgi:hypothetical protein